MMHQRFVLIAALTTAAVPLLQGCFPVVAAGTAVGAMSVVDRRTTGAQVDDKSIEFRAGRSIEDRVPPVKAHASVKSYNRRALLTGQVSSEEVKQEVGRIVAGEANVREVVNELEVAGGSSGFGSSANDAYITGKVKASLLEAKDIPDGSIKIVTERGVVYMLGLLSQSEAERAAQIAAGVSGVLKVVKVFEILSDEEVARINAGRAPSGTPAPKSTAPR